MPKRCLGFSDAESTMVTPGMRMLCHHSLLGLLSLLGQARRTSERSKSAHARLLLVVSGEPGNTIPTKSP